MAWYVEKREMKKPARLGATLLCAASFPALMAIMVPVAQAQSGQASVSQPVVQSLPSKDVSKLAEALQRLSRNPRDVDALVEAGHASIAVGDVDAAIGFFGRAQALEPNNVQVLIGLAKTNVHANQPLQALGLFGEAERAGASPVVMASYRGLAYDLVGDQLSAQEQYRNGLNLTADEKLRHRLALSQAISGDRQGFELTLAPLIEARNFSAYRTRAFGLAILGEGEDAVSLTEAVMPQELSARIGPYLHYMPRLTGAQQAAAANLGIFPQAPQIGRDTAAIAQYRQNAKNAQMADARLEPKGAPLGRPANADARPQTSPNTNSSEPAAASKAEPKKAKPKRTKRRTSTRTSSSKSDQQSRSERLASARARAQRRARSNDPLARLISRPRIVVKTAPPASAPDQVTSSAGEQTAQNTAAPTAAPANEGLVENTAVTQIAQADVVAIEPKPSPVTEPTAEPVPATEPEPTPTSEPATETEPTPTPEPATETEPEPTPTSEPATETEPELTPISEPKPATELEPTPEPVRLALAETAASSAGEEAGSNSDKVEAAEKTVEQTAEQAAEQVVEEAESVVTGELPAIETAANNVPVPSVPVQTVSAAEKGMMQIDPGSSNVASASEAVSGAMSQAEQEDVSKEISDGSSKDASKSGTSQADDNVNSGASDKTPSSDPEPSSDTEPAPATTSAPDNPTASEVKIAEAPKTLADAFAKFNTPAALPSSSSSGAVDITAIKAPRETAAKPKASQPSQSSAEIHPSRIWVQVATGKNRSALKFDWRRISKSSPDAIGDMSAHVVKWGESNRLLAGPFSNRKAARNALNALSENGTSGFIYTSPKGQEIKRLN